MLIIENLKFAWNDLKQQVKKYYEKMGKKPQVKREKLYILVPLMEYFFLLYLFIYLFLKIYLLID